MTMACLRDMKVVKCSHYTTGRGWAPLHFNFTPHDFSFSKVETVVYSIIIIIIMMVRLCLFDT